MSSRKETGKLIIDLCSIENGLTNWEMEFIDNMAQKFKLEQEISIGMFDKMYEILKDRE